MEIENLTQEQLKAILESLGYTLLFRKEILMLKIYTYFFIYKVIIV